MDRAEFEAELHREGYEVRDGGIAPDQHRQLHTHDVDIRLLVLAGSITLAYEEGRCSFGPGDTCLLPAGTLHAEHTEADGVTYLIGRRAAAQADAAQ